MIRDLADELIEIQKRKAGKLAKQNQQPYTKTRRNQNKYEPRAFNQRAIVITKYTKRTELITKHIRYLERDEAHEGIQNKMKLHNATKIKRTIPGEEKYFKIILSPEQGNKMDMDQYVKRFISRIELSLNKEITAYWTVHNNTAKTHAHIIIRGVNENREVITIPKDIITKGMREIAETEATRQLGPRTKQDIEKQLEHELKETRLTTHDRKIIKMAINNSVTTTNTWIIKRLAYLEHMNLAKQTENLTWKIDENLEQKLRKLNKTLDIQKTLQKHNARTLYIPKSYSYTHGKVVETGFIDEMSDTEYVLVKTKKDLLAKIIIRETTAEEFKIGDEIVYRNGKLKHYEETEEHRQQQELMDAIREKIGYTKFKFYKNEDISGYVIHTIQTEDREGIIIRTDDDKIVYMETTEQIEDNGQITIQNGKIITEGIGQTKQ